ncbi:MAG: ABC transporter permease [Trueperaceae bacterium]|nr:ABC transporter permease [Trueperaceae bacterium]
MDVALEPKFLHRRTRLGRWWESKSVRRFRRNPLAIVGLFIVVAFVVIATIAPLITPLGRNCVRDLGLTPATATSVRNPTNPAFWQVLFSPPGSCYKMPRVGFSPIPQPAATSGTVLGTTSQGYDIYYGLMWGARTAFRIGVIVVGIGLTIGLIVGATAAYVGGWVDNVLMRFTDVIIAVPALVLALVIVMVLGNSIVNLMIAIAAVAWPGYARLIRGEVLRIKELEYVTGARALGRQGAGIVFRHILPNAIGPVLIVASLDIGSIVLTAAALSFLGLGPELGYTDWGQMISFARNWILGPPGQPLAYWYTSFWPGLTIVLFVLGWNLLGDAFRDVLDVRSNT